MKKIKNGPLLSIIVPIYNAEKYLNKCIDSLVGQSYRELEIILVNDGSKDSSLKICNNYRCDSRVVIIDKENGGVNSAREKGLKVASGQYITFVDADDVLELSAYAVCMSILAETKCDLLVYRYHTELASKFSNNHDFSLDDIQFYLIEKDDRYNNFMDKKYFGGTIWNKIWKADCLKDVSFRKDLFIAEDSVFFWDSLKNVDCTVLVEAELYHYRYSLDNATNKSSVEKYCTGITAWSYLKKEAFLKKSSSYANICKNRLMWIIKAAKSVAINRKSQKHYKEFIAEIEKDSKYINRLSVLDRLYALVLRRKWYFLFECIANLELFAKKIIVFINQNK